MDEALAALGLKFEDLTKEERKYYLEQLKVMAERPLGAEDIRFYIGKMRRSVEEELTKFDLGNKQDLFLKARLRNYMLLEEFLTTHARAKAAYEKATRDKVKT